MAVYAITDGDTCINVIEWDGQEDYSPPPACSLIEVTDGSVIGPGWLQINGRWVCPAPYDSWTLDSELIWQPPVSMPSDGKSYLWDEASRSWISFSDENPARLSAISKLKALGLTTEEATALVGA